MLTKFIKVEIKKLNINEYFQFSPSSVMSFATLASRVKNSLSWGVLDCFAKFSILSAFVSGLKSVASKSV